ncbi:unnamed protein product [Spirodela intermedia]|uniref:Uncharacterized protein n=1 Tax=Spirodela intermedia TaxID=51605 RepID=A0A7I8KSL5_SPIIN|nr:unnamed protein product [Spirodela intermedia]
MTLVETWVSSPWGPSLASPKSESFALKASPFAAPTAIFSLAAPGHELVHEKAVLFLAAVAYELDEHRSPTTAAPPAEDRSYQPFAVALVALLVEQLHGHLLRLQPRPELLVHEPLVHRPEAALSDEMAAGEVLRHRLQLRQLNRPNIFVRRSPLAARRQPLYPICRRFRRRRRHLLRRP